MADPVDILLIDLATTGTNAAKDDVLEVAYILTQSPGFPIIEEGTFVVAHPDGVQQKTPKFHAALVKEAESAEATPRERIEAELLALPKPAIIANRAINFDLDFIRVHFPAFARTLRFAGALDIKALGKVMAPISGGGFPEPEHRTHRATDEVIHAYEELTYYGDAVEEAGVQ